MRKELRQLYHRMAEQGFVTLGKPKRASNLVMYQDFEAVETAGTFLPPLAMGEFIFSRIEYSPTNIILSISWFENEK